MRKPNINLKKIKLQQAELQLEQYIQRRQALEAKLSAISEKYLKKYDQVDALRKEVSALETAQAPTQADVAFPLGDNSGNLQ